MAVKPLRDDHGAIAVVAAIFALVMFGFAALVVDLGIARDVRREARGAADAAAVAAAAELDGSVTATSDAIGVAKNYVQANLTAPPPDWGACPAVPTGWATVSGRTKCVAFDSLSAPTKVRIAVPLRDMPSIFGGAFGYGGGTTSAAAVASVAEAKVCALCVFGDVAVAGRIDVVGEGSFSARDSASPITGHISVADGPILFTNQPDPPSGSAFYDPDPPEVTGEPVHDPSRDPGSVGSGPASDGDCGPSDPLPPGIYHDVDVSGDCQLLDGTFVITGLLKINGGNHVVGNNVTLALVCEGPAGASACKPSGEAGGRIDVGGNGSLTIYRPRQDGVAVYFDPHNVQSSGVSGLASGGSSSVSITGAIYGRRTSVALGGNSSMWVMGQVGLLGVTVPSNAKLTVDAVVTAIPDPDDVRLVE